MPRPSLRRAQPMISEFCQQHGLPYCQAGLVGSYAQALRYLHAVGTEVPVAIRLPAPRLSRLEDGAALTPASATGASGDSGRCPAGGQGRRRGLIRHGSLLR